MSSFALTLRQQFPTIRRAVLMDFMRRVNWIADNHSKYIELAVRVVLASVAIAISAVMALIIISLGIPVLSSIAIIGTAFIWVVAAESMFEDDSRYVAFPVIIQAVLAVSAAVAAISSGQSRNFILGWMVWEVSFKSMFIPLGIIIALEIQKFVITYVIAAFTWRVLPEEKILPKPLTPAQIAIMKECRRLSIRGIALIGLAFSIAILMISLSLAAWLMFVVCAVPFTAGVKLLERAEKMEDDLLEREGVLYKDLPHVKSRREARGAKMAAMSRVEKLRYYGMRLVVAIVYLLLMLVWSIVEFLLLVVWFRGEAIYIIPSLLNAALPFVLLMLFIRLKPPSNVSAEAS